MTSHDKDHYANGVGCISPSVHVEVGDVLGREEGGRVLLLVPGGGRVKRLVKHLAGRHHLAMGMRGHYS